MKNDVIVKVENLCKNFKLYGSPKHRLLEALHPLRKKYHHDFCALKDISFEIKRGESFGILGKNGAGKSTLLKLITGVLTPTSGTVEVKGRVAALLELGSGFNPELTGMENIFFQGAIMGFTRIEMSQKVDLIVNFADIGEFIHQPVKTYSSGMFVRLAFSIMAHVDADILIIDEALSVGDAVFTQKCMSFIRNFQSKGTLIFVSHDIASVQSLCGSALWISNSKIEKIGKAKKVAEAYLQHNLQEIYGDSLVLNKMCETTEDQTYDFNEEEGVIDYCSDLKVIENHNATGWKTNKVDILSIKFENINPSKKNFEGGEKIQVIIKAKAFIAIEKPIIGFAVKDRLGQVLFGENTLYYTDKVSCSIAEGQEFEGRFQFRLPMLPNGDYAVMASVAEGTLYKNIQHHYFNDALIINVTSSKVRFGLVGVSFEKISLEVTN